MDNNPSRFKGEGQQPVELFSWDDCQEFLTKINVLGQGVFRLPTEAEWEYAYRAGSTTAYYLEDDPVQLDAYAWYGANSNSQTHPVGQKEPNAWGLYDMSGNVWEWCHDWYGPYPSGSVIDPTGPDSGMARVLRGGSWFSYPSICRSADRFDNTPVARYDNIGFRVVQTQ